MQKYYLEILEKILVENGRIVDHPTVSSYFSHLSNINKKISNYIQKGWLVKIRKGLYYIAKLGTLGHTSLTSYTMANIIGELSFISFEGALKYHGIFDQGLKKYKSVSKKQYLDKVIDGIKYTYVTVKEESYFGYTVERVDAKINIATRERALLDLIEYQRTIGSVSLVIEKFREYENEIDLTLLLDYLPHYSQVTIKTLGLIFDFFNLNSKLVEQLVNSKTSTHKLSKNSDKFNNKWRLYYNPIIMTWLDENEHQKRIDRSMVSIKGWDIKIRI